MGTQQILEILAKLIAKMDANQADQARMEPEMKDDRKANKDMLTEMSASMKSN
jgi:hypothetical protein